MKTEIVTKPKPDPTLPAVGQLWKPVDSELVYLRINDDQGASALDLGKAGRFFSVSLQTGAIVWSDYESSWELLQPLGGEPLKLEVVS